MICDCGHSATVHGLRGCLVSLPKRSAKRWEHTGKCHCRRSEDELAAIERDLNEPRPPTYYDEAGRRYHDLAIVPGSMAV